MEVLSDSLEEDENAVGEQSKQFKHKATEALKCPKSVKRLCLRDCSVVLERIIFKEVMVTAPSPDKREVFYVSTYDECEDEENVDSMSFFGDDRYEDWRLQIVDALDYRNLKKRKKKKRLKSSNEDGPVLKLFMRFPESQEDVFIKDYASGDLHSILNILSGEAMYAPILDAYLLIRLEQYWKKIQESDVITPCPALKKCTKHKTDYRLRLKEEGNHNFEANEKRSSSSQRKKPINYQYLSYNFMPVKERDQSKFKVNMNFYPELEPEVLHSCHLIAPQYASKHFYLAVFDFPSKCVQIHDSSWHYLPLTLRILQLKAILRAFVKEDSINWKFDIVKRSSPQYDEYSCGIYTIYYAETLLKGAHIKRNCRKLPTQTVKEIRKRVVKELLNTTSRGRKFLKAISHS